MFLIPLHLMLYEMVPMHNPAMEIANGSLLPIMISSWDNLVKQMFIKDLRTICIMVPLKESKNC